jgi:hypothetical protein
MCKERLVLWLVATARTAAGAGWATVDGRRRQAADSSLLQRLRLRPRFMERTAPRPLAAGATRGVAGCAGCLRACALLSPARRSPARPTSRRGPPKRRRGIERLAPAAAAAHRRPPELVVPRRAAVLERVHVAAALHRVPHPLVAHPRRVVSVAVPALLVQPAGIKGVDVVGPRRLGGPQVAQRCAQGQAEAQPYPAVVDVRRVLQVQGLRPHDGRLLWLLWLLRGLGSERLLRGLLGRCVEQLGAAAGPRVSAPDHPGEQRSAVAVLGACCACTWCGRWMGGVSGRSRQQAAGSSSSSSSSLGGAGAGAGTGRVAQDKLQTPTWKRCCENKGGNEAALQDPPPVRHRGPRCLVYRSRCGGSAEQSIVPAGRRQLWMMRATHGLSPWWWHCILCECE